VQIQALASDYDHTLAYLGKVTPSTLAALKRFRESGRKFILVTGRRMDDLLNVFSEIDICDGVVAENGAVLYWPKEKRMELLCSVPPQSFVQALYERRVPPLAVGHAVIAMLAHQASEVDALIVEHGLDLEKSFNKEAMMILPKGVDKAYGLKACLGFMGIAAKRVVGVGDAENDEPFLKLCGIAAAPANSIPSVQAIAQYHLRAEHGAGVEELIELILTGDSDDPGDTPPSSDRARTRREPPRD